MSENYFGRALRKARIAKKKTLEDVSEFLSMSSAHISDVERGRRSPWDFERIEPLAKYLEVDPIYLQATCLLDKRPIVLPTRSIEDAKGWVTLIRNYHKLDWNKLTEI